MELVRVVGCVGMLVSLFFIVYMLATVSLPFIRVKVVNVHFVFILLNLPLLKLGFCASEKDICL